MLLCYKHKDGFKFLNFYQFQQSTENSKWFGELKGKSKEIEITFFQTAYVPVTKCTGFDSKLSKLNKLNKVLQLLI